MKTKKLIGLVGYKGSGKSVAGSHLEVNKGYTRLPFAGPLKKMLAQGLQIPNDYIYGKDKEAVVPGLEVTGRYLMQTLGTEWARNCLGADFWTKCMGISKEFIESERVVIDDVRFLNEAQWIRNRGGILIRITRPGCGGVDKHASEAEIGQVKEDYTIKNEGTIGDLVGILEFEIEDIEWALENLTK